ncbi:unnamed protein product [Protopolystoma xenopodis]|uniref:Uncharacterized protein n=1 Tax=Protopolystoma xenopodis TaxID=117903 RepID=A0A3S5CJ19_9PLAT|nr:unnamed protein product [Protopolystoma xenopodis]
MDVISPTMKMTHAHAHYSLPRPPHLTNTFRFSYSLQDPVNMATRPAHVTASAPDPNTVCISLSHTLVVALFRSLSLANPRSILY